MKSKDKDIKNTAFVETGVAFWHTFVERCRQIAEDKLRSKKYINLTDTQFGKQPYMMLSDGKTIIPKEVLWKEDNGEMVVFGVPKGGTTASIYSFEDMAQDAITLSDFMHAILGDLSEAGIQNEKEEKARNWNIESAIKMLSSWKDTESDKDLKRKIHNIVASIILADGIRHLKFEYQILKGYMRPSDKDTAIIAKAEKAARKAMEDVLYNELSK